MSRFFEDFGDLSDLASNNKRVDSVDAKKKNEEEVNKRWAKRKKLQLIGAALGTTYALNKVMI